MVGTRFCMDTHSTGAVLLRLAGECSPDDLSDLISRLSVIYEALNPRRKTPHGA